jgi:hypothetical protein
VNEELLKEFAEVVGPTGITGDVVSPADEASLVLVATVCHRHGVPISVTSSAPATPAGTS